MGAGRPQHRRAARRPARARRRNTQPHPGGYANAAELVAGLKSHRPVRHLGRRLSRNPPGSADRESDLDNLKRKVDAGADRAITQFFFSPECFLRFQDEVAAAGIDVEIVPGILPVSNVATTRRFAADLRRGAFPAGWTTLFEGLDDLPAARQLIAATVAAELCGQLYAGGVRHFHFYTLNRAELSYAICHFLGVQGQSMSAAETLRAEAAKRILIKDGAYGTLIQAERLQGADYCGGLDLMKDQRGNNDLLNLTRPEVVRAICESFADAGADILATNTFNANAISQADYGAEALVAARSTARRRRSPARSPTAMRPRTASRAGSRARSARPTRRCRCRPTSTIRAFARSTSTR